MNDNVFIIPIPIDTFEVLMEKKEGFLKFQVGDLKEINVPVNPLIMQELYTFFYTEKYTNLNDDSITIPIAILDNEILHPLFMMEMNLIEEAKIEIFEFRMNGRIVDLIIVPISKEMIFDTIDDIENNKIISLNLGNNLIIYFEKEQLNSAATYNNDDIVNFACHKISDEKLEVLGLYFEADISTGGEAKVVTL